MKDERILQWIINSGIKTDKSESFELSRHAFLKDILTDFSKQIVVRKCSQVGMTLCFILKALYLAYLYKDQRLLSVLFTLPTSDVMADFVKTKFDPIVANSSIKASSEGISPKEKVYSVQLKKIFGSFFFFRGASSTSAAQSVAGDILLADEFDFQNQSIKSMFEERLTGSSSLGISWFLSVPYLPKCGVSAIFEESNQNEWWIQCQECKKLQTLTWPESVNKEKKIYVCKHCGCELTDSARQKGIWRPKYPNRKISGYSVSRLMAPWISAEQLLESQKKGDAHFYRYALGLPYKSKESAKVLDNFPNLIFSSEFTGGRTVLGIDQGDRYHAVLLRIKPGLRLIEDIHEFESPQDLLDYIVYIKPDLTIMEGLPAKQIALNMQRKIGKNKFLILYEQNLTLSSEDFFKYNQDIGSINTDRTQMIDHLFYLMDLGIIRWKKGIPNIEELKLHLSNLVPVERPLRGVVRKFYEKTGQSDYSFALFFANLGAQIIYPFEENKVDLNNLTKGDKITPEEYEKQLDEKNFSQALIDAKNREYELDSTILIRQK